MKEITSITLTDLFPDGAADKVTTTTAVVDIATDDSVIVLGVGECSVERQEQKHWPLEVHLEVICGRLEISVYDKRLIIGATHKMKDESDWDALIDTLEAQPLSSVTILPNGKALVETLCSEKQEVQVECD